MPLGQQVGSLGAILSSNVVVRTRLTHPEKEGRDGAVTRGTRLIHSHAAERFLVLWRGCACQSAGGA